MDDFSKLVQIVYYVIMASIAIVKEVKDNKNSEEEKTVEQNEKDTQTAGASEKRKIRKNKKH